MKRDRNEESGRMLRIERGDRGFRFGHGAALALRVRIAARSGSRRDGLLRRRFRTTLRRQRPRPNRRRCPNRAATAPEPATPAADPAIAALAERANTMLKPLPTSVPNPENEGTPAKIDLGRMLYYDTRLSKNHDSRAIPATCSMPTASTTSRLPRATRAPAATATRRPSTTRRSTSPSSGTAARRTSRSRRRVRS